jgi:chromosome partitioning protein
MAIHQDMLGMGAWWLSDRLAEISGYDYILLDTAPSWDILSMAGLLACQDVLMPISTEFLTLTSAADYVRVIEDVRRHNTHLHVSWIVPTFVDRRTMRSGEILAALCRTFGKLVVAPIRINSDLSAAASAHQSIFEYAGRSRGAEDYQTLVGRLGSG